MTGRCFSLTCLPLRQPRRISIHPGLFSMPGSQSVLETPVAASLDAAFLPDREPCGSVRHPTGGRCRTFIARENLSLSKRCQPGSVALQEVSKSDPGVGLLHSLRMEKTHAESVASAYVNARS